MADTAIVDVDGTLVDSNYHHALAWFRAFRRFDITLPVWHLHRAIGMGGDQLVSHVAGSEVEHHHGDDLRVAHTEEFDALIGEICALPDAQRLLAAIKDRGFHLVLATSGQPEHVERFLDLIDGRTHADVCISSDDVTASKPAPDLITLALDRVSGRSGVVVGDSIWDAIAATRAGQCCLAVRTGGFSPAELREAGARTVFDSLPDLLGALDDTPLSRPGADV